MHLRPFEIGLIAAFGIMGIAGLFFLSVFKATPSDKEKLYGENISIWGTLDQGVMSQYLIELIKQDAALKAVTYTEIDPRKFDNELVNAIAEGRSPDLVILPHSLLVTYQPKLYAISFDVLSERTFRDTYIDGADIFMRSDGIYGLPFAVDPLVMYWNKDLFSGSGIATPPKTWETLTSQTVPALVRTDESNEITQSAISFGEYSNVKYAKDIVSMLMLQSGNTIVAENAGQYSVVLNRSENAMVSPGEAALSFYTQFVNPTKNLYTWNRSQSLDRTEFLQGTLAMYFGRGSERKLLERDNPNLNFDVAVVPQGSGVTTKRDYGEFYAFAIPRASKNISGAYAVASVLGKASNVEQCISAYDFAPVQRALYTGVVNDPFRDILYQSALISHGWLDPAPQESTHVFRNMIERVSSESGRAQGALMDAAYQLEALF